MCNGGGGGSNDALEYQREQQAARAQRIQQGLDMISRMFDGGAVGTDPAETFDPGQLYYNAQGQVIYDPAQAVASPGAAPPRFAGSGRYDGSRHYGGPGSVRTPRQTDPAYAAYQQQKAAYAAQQQRIEAALSGNGLYTDTEQTGGFGPEFYQQRAEAYLDFANPQLEDQYEDAGEALTYQLARQGTLASSLAADRRADLGQDYQQAQQDIANTAQGYASQAKAAVAQERSSLVNALMASANPSAISATASGTLDALRSQPKHQMLGQAFEGVTAGLGSYLQGARYNDMQGRIGSMYDLSGRGSGRVVNG